MQSFSTNLVPSSDRLDAWHTTAQQICGDCRFYFPKQARFHGSIERRLIGELECTQFSSSSVSFAKFPHHEKLSGEGYCIFITQLRGVRSYSQNGSVAILQPGDTTLIDSCAPWASRCDTDCARLYLRVPRWVVEDRLRRTSIPFARRINGQFGLGATLHEYFVAMYRRVEQLTLDEAKAAVDAYLGLLGACLRAPANALPHRHHSSQELMSKIEDFVERRLADPGLNPAEIAEAAGISVRHLHRVFEGRQLTVADWIRERRLLVCAAALAEPQLRRTTVTEVAYSWGFSDSAHFSRSFKQRFGISPKLFREQACSEALWTTRPLEDLNVKRLSLRSRPLA